MYKNWFLAFPLICVLAMAPPGARAQEGDTQFDAYVAKGVDAYKSRKYNAAIKYFRDAYALKTDPTLIFNIARSYERLGKIEDALSNYQAYVDAPGTTAEDRADALNRIKALKQEQVARDAAQSEDEPPPPTLPQEAKAESGNNGRTEGVKLEAARRADVETKANHAVPRAGLVLIVHRANPVVSLTRAQLEDIYFGRTLTWTGGTRVRPYGRPSNTEASKIFFSSATGVDAGRYSQHWQRRQLSGAGLAPATVDGATTLVKTVAANPGAIGYLSGSELPANMEGVRVIELRAADEK